MQPGIEIFEQHAKLNERVRAAQLVLTGEGEIDDQTLMGKGVGEIANICRALSIDCVALAGVMSVLEQANTKFTAMYALSPGLVDKQTALREPTVWLERLTTKVATEWR